MKTFLTQFLLIFLWLGTCSISSAATKQPSPPFSRIVSLAPHLTELAFAAGAGDRIYGTVEYSDYPEAAKSIPRVGDAFLVDFERILAIAPDAVLAWDTGTPQQTIARLRELGLHVEVFSTQRIQDIVAELRRLGKLAGTERIAQSAAAQFESDMEGLRTQYRDRARVTVFLQINDRPLYTVNGAQIISEVANLCGGTNVFANLNELAPAIGEEAVIASDPEVIVSTDETVPDPMARWRSWRSMRAVRAGNLFSLPSDDLARPTMRLVSGARAMCRALDTARARLVKRD